MCFVPGLGKRYLSLPLLTEPDLEARITWVKEQYWEKEINRLTSLTSLYKIDQLYNTQCHCSTLIEMRNVMIYLKFHKDQNFSETGIA